jgi:hypothetical protein
MRLRSFAAIEPWASPSGVSSQIQYRTSIRHERHETHENDQFLS